MSLSSSTTLAAKFGWNWLWHLGGPGLILVGLVDNSVIPTPGGMDILTVILTVKQRQLWGYYGLMAVAGSLIGGYVFYRLRRQGGKEGVEKSFRRQRRGKGLQK